MQGRLQSVEQDRKGKIIGRIETDDGIKNLYGLSTMSVAPDTLIEYEMTTSRSGFAYAKFIGYAKAADAYRGENETDRSSEAVAGRTCIPEVIADGYMTVSQLNEMIRQQMQNTPRFQDFWVKGEVTNYGGHRTHYYFSIKDDNALISCFLWEYNAASALDFKLESGQKVAIKGSLEFYDKRGTCSINVSKIINIGEGDARLRYLQLKEKLQNEGIFDIEHHKEIPRHADRVGIVTSKDGQAIRDICKVAKERNPYVQLVLFHVNVQGSRAVETIIEGIERLDKEKLDVIIVGRGGGSDEELLVYNDEMVVRAVYNAKTPIVSAVGHEGHTPLVDGAADARFATPTDAAQHVISDVMSEINRVDELRRHMSEQIATRLNQTVMRLAKVKAEIDKNSPKARLQERTSRLNLVRQQMQTRMDRIFSEISQRYIKDAGTLDGLSPTAKLVRGFGYISVNGKPVRTVDDLKAGDDFSVKIHDGDINAKVTALNKNSEESR